MNKISMTGHQLCIEMRCPLLIDFANEVYGIGFKEKPNYGKLRFLLTKEMLNVDLMPSLKFDWNEYEESKEN